MKIIEARIELTSRDQIDADTTQYFQTMTSKWYKLGTLELVEKILKAARKLYSRQIPTEQTQLQLLPWPISTNT